MKKTVFTLIALFILLNSFATIRRVNNNPGVILVPNIVYVNFVTAVNEASTGDTIYIEPSITNYTITPNTFNLTKKLTFIGNGYNIGNNAGLINPLPFQTSESTLGGFNNNLNINVGAENSEFYGITFSSLNSFVVNASNIKFDRCKFSVGIFINSSNNIVQRSFFANENNTLAGSFTSLNNFFSNCIFQTLYGHFNAIFDRCYVNSLNNFAPVIENCVFTNSIINIIASAVSLTNTFTNCIKIGGTFPIAGINNNIENVSMSNIFIAANPQIAPLQDRNYRLSPTSPALGTGMSGTDIGPFGGTFPYRLSGQPQVPIITNFFLSTTGSTASGLTGSITIQANN